MRYLLDASAIYRAIETKRKDLIEDAITLDLARYEVGNAILKDVMIHKRMDLQKAQQVMEFINELFENIEIVTEAQGDDVIKTASFLGVSFYDAAYVSYAKRTGLVFVTEDVKLSKKIKSYIEHISIEALPANKII